MEKFRCECMIFGTKNIHEISDSILKDLHIKENPRLEFDLKLIMIEAIANAHKHGNNFDEKKPIILRVIQTEFTIRIEVQDSGIGFKDVVIPNVMEENHFLDESGRGLYLINCVSDYMEFKHNMVVINKNL